MSAAHVLSPVLRTTAVVCGAHFLSYLLTGRGLIARARDLALRIREPDELSPPSDPVDEASWESFPASDPPAISAKPST
jgi:hypothetical protein